MDRDAAVTVMMRKLSFRTGIEAACVTALQTAQRQLEARAYMLPNGLTTPMPWFLEVRDDPLTLVSGQNYIDLPDGFLAEIEEAPPYFYNLDDARVELAKANASLLNATFPAAGPPLGYYMAGRRLYLSPAPDDAYILYTSYYEADEVLTTNIENNWLANMPDLLIGVAGEELAGDYRDEKAKVEFQRLITIGANMLWRRTLEGELTNRRTAIGVAK